jgi:pimeloyl-ACP methyl ester carboxylesterase
VAIVETSIELRSGRFRILSEGTGPLALVLHGFPDHPPTFARVIARLASAGYRVVAPWLRGYAPSPLEGPFDVDRVAADVLELATALGHDRFALVGHDWGAVITYHLCAIAPARVGAALTLAVPHPSAMLRALRGATQLARSWYMLLFQVPGAPYAAAARDFALIDLLWRRWSPGYRLDAEARRALHACLAASMPAPIEYYRAAARRMLRGVPAMPPLSTPVCYVHGADDGCIGTEVSRGQERWFAGPFAQEVIPGAGHFLQLEAPDVVAARADAWLGAHLGA